MTQCDVYGTLILGSPNSDSFTFREKSNIIVHANGVLEDQTNSHQLNIPARSLITIYPDGSFVGSDTYVNTHSTSRAAAAGSGSTLLGSHSKGPLTYGILPDGKIATYNKVTYIVAKSGDFTNGLTWLGSIPPSADICALVGGCGLQISSGCVLTTASLHGLLNVEFDLIVIATRAIFELGTVGPNGNFYFQFPTRIDIFGTLKYIPSNNDGIYLPIQSAFNFYAGATFSSTFQVTIHVYNPASNITIGTGIPIDSTFRGPYYASISITGVIQTSNTRK
jgi:hypothetical protein